MILEPIPGNPEAVLVLAESLEGSAEDLRATLTSMRGLSVGAVWDGPAGTAFAASLADLAPILQRVLDRYAVAALALRSHAPELAGAQDLAQAAIADAGDASWQISAIERQIETAMSTGETWDSPRVQGLLATQRHQVWRQQRAVGDHHAAWSAVEASDGRCAAALTQCADDPISDPALYRVLHRVSATGSAVSQVGVLSFAAPELTPVATIAGTAGSVADGLLLVGYGEGDWSSVAVGLGLSAVGSAGGALKKGATAGAIKTANGEYRVVERMATRQRLGVGVSREVGAKIDGLHGLKSVPTGREATTALLGFQAKMPLRDKVREGVRTSVVGFAEKKLLNDLRLVRANGTTRMFVAGVTLQGVEKGTAKVIDRREEKPAEK